MKKICILLLLCVFTFYSYAVMQPTITGLDRAVSMEEEDGAPSVLDISKVKVTNGTLTDNSDGTVSLVLTGGSGDSVTVNGVNVDSVANFKDDTDVTFTRTDGGAGGPDDVKAYVVDDSHNHTYANIDQTTSANWIGRVSDETGTGAWVFGTTPTIATPVITGNISSEPKYLRFNLVDPLATQTEDNEICIWPVTDADITITKITVTLDSAANEIAGDLKYADTFIGLANPVVVNTFDTTAGVLADDSITSGGVAAGKTIYISFDSAPNTAIKQACFEIRYDYD